jgi:hypothetical protein
MLSKTMMNEIKYAMKVYLNRGEFFKNAKKKNISKGEVNL